MAKQNPLKVKFILLLHRNVKASHKKHDLGPLHHQVISATLLLISIAVTFSPLQNSILFSIWRKFGLLHTNASWILDYYGIHLLLNNMYLYLCMFYGTMKKINKQPGGTTKFELCMVERTPNYRLSYLKT